MGAINRQLEPYLRMIKNGVHETQDTSDANLSCDPYRDYSETTASSPDGKIFSKSVLQSDYKLFVKPIPEKVRRIYVRHFEYLKDDNKISEESVSEKKDDESMERLNPSIESTITSNVKIRVIKTSHSCKKIKNINTKKSRTNIQTPLIRTFCNFLWY